MYRAFFLKPFAVKNPFGVFFINYGAFFHSKALATVTPGLTHCDAERGGGRVTAVGERENPHPNTADHKRHRLGMTCGGRRAGGKNAVCALKNPLKNSAQIFEMPYKGARGPQALLVLC